MNEYELAVSCLPDLQEERDHLASMLPSGVLSPRADAPKPDEPPRCAVLAWARSGLMHLTGLTCGPPLAPTAPVLPRAAAIAAAITELTGPASVRLNLERVLAFRASLAGWSRRGRVSANGTCQILRAADGWLAVNLARPDDLACVPAILGRDLHGSSADELRAEAALRPAAELATTAQALGVPAAALGTETPPPVILNRIGAAGQASHTVLDLSAMWAGPLCAHILARAGWRVIKVEDVNRPDGARFGPAAFFTGLHAGSQTVTLDFATPEGRGALIRLARSAGIVIESSRPRALHRLGLVAADWLTAAPGRVWVSVTGYGRSDPQQRVAFGDDAAVAGGLVARASDGTPVFCGDAIADPFSGLYAGLAALAAHADGGGWLVDIAMAGVCADLARPTSGQVWRHGICQTGRTWAVRHGELSQRVAVL
jgi:CoA transferase family III